MAVQDHTGEWIYWTNVRRSVIDFAIEMERVLRKNDYKSGWDTCEVGYLVGKLFEETGEFSREYFRYANISHSSEETIDIANICMMLWERLNFRGDKND